jgi:hypothetical protein
MRYRSVIAVLVAAALVPFVASAQDEGQYYGVNKQHEKLAFKAVNKLIWWSLKGTITVPSDNGESVNWRFQARWDSTSNRIIHSVINDAGGNRTDLTLVGHWDEAKGAWVLWWKAKKDRGVPTTCKPRVILTGRWLGAAGTLYLHNDHDNHYRASWGGVAGHPLLQGELRGDFNGTAWTGRMDITEGSVTATGIFNLKYTHSQGPGWENLGGTFVITNSIDHTPHTSNVSFLKD